MEIWWMESYKKYVPGHIHRNAVVYNKPLESKQTFHRRDRYMGPLARYCTRGTACCDKPGISCSTDLVAVWGVDCTNGCLLLAETEMGHRTFNVPACPHSEPIQILNRGRASVRKTICTAGQEILGVGKGLSLSCCLETLQNWLSNLYHLLQILH